jgi:putative membrane-bound dehydrogenase-like protein
MNRPTLVFVFALCALPAASQQDEPKSPLSAKDALKTWRLPDGFKIELVAAEPDLMDPVAMAFDENGRIYVAEMADYPLGPPSGRIKLLESTKGDGTYDKCTTFASNVPYPNGVMPWKGGVLVTAAPDILYFKDTKGDGKADVREVVWTGFSEGNQQHRVNGLQFGLDNWIYGANGDSGGNVRPGNQADAKRTSIRGSDFRFKTDFTGIEPVAGASQYANTFDDWGNRYMNNNSNHIYTAVLPLRYLGRNPSLSVAAVQEMISDHGPASQVYPASRITERFNDYNTAGHFTSACSVTIYRGDGLGPDFRGNAFCCEPVHNLVHRDLLVQKGASFTAKRAYENKEFLASTDTWSRPVNLCTGPDGMLYVVDMYRAVIEHPQWIPLEVQRRVDLRAGWDKGRIYRVSPTASKPAALPSLGKASPAELVALLEKENAWWRLTAQRLLIEKQDQAAVQPLRALFHVSRSPLARLHALWTLEGLGALETTDVARALKDADAGVREHALRLAEPRIAELRDAVLALVADAAPRVRFQLAFTLGEVRDDRALAALAKIAVQDATDRWVQTAILSSIKGSAQKLLSKILQSSPDFLEKAGPGSMELVRQLADLTGAGRNEEEVADWLKLLAEGSGAQPARWRLVALSALGPSLRRWGASLDSLLKKAGVEKQVGEWSARLLETAGDGARDVAERVNAIDLLAMMPGAGTREGLGKLLRPQEPQDVQVAAVRALSSAPADQLLANWAAYTGPVRKAVLAALFARPDQIPLILEKLEKNEIRTVELEVHHRDQLLKNPKGEIRARAKALLEGKAANELDELVDQMAPKVFALTGDRGRGEKVYMTNCATCHRLHGQGFKVGADLTSVAGRDRLSLLTDILNPNKAIDPQFQVYVVKTPKGELISGVIAAETPASITLRRANAEENTVLRRDIAEIKAWPASLMPEGIEKNVSPQDFADLFVFLGASIGPVGKPKSFEGNKPEIVKAAGDGSVKLLATQCEIYGNSMVFEAAYKNLGYWSSESDQAVWSLETAKAGKYAVEIDYACENGVAGNAYLLEAGASRLAGKIEGTGNWDNYKQVKLGTVDLKAGPQKLSFHSEGKIQGALLDLRSVRLVPE